MSKVLALYLSLNILASTLMVPFVYLDFEVRKDYIAKVLCINRDKPITACGGQCFLAKQLNKIKTQQEKDTKHSHQVEQINFFNEATLIAGYNQGFSIIKNSFVTYHGDTSLSSFLTDIFHPPQQS